MCQRCHHAGASQHISMLERERWKYNCYLGLYVSKVAQCTFVILILRELEIMIRGKGNVTNRNVWLRFFEKACRHELSRYHSDEWRMNHAWMSDLSRICCSPPFFMFSFNYIECAWLRCCLFTFRSSVIVTLIWFCVFDNPGPMTTIQKGLECFARRKQVAEEGGIDWWTLKGLGWHRCSVGRKHVVKEGGVHQLTLWGSGQCRCFMERKQVVKKGGVNWLTFKGLGQHKCPAGRKHVAKEGRVDQLTLQDLGRCRCLAGREWDAKKGGIDWLTLKGLGQHRCFVGRKWVAKKGRVDKLTLKGGFRMTQVLCKKEVIDSRDFRMTPVKEGQREILRVVFARAQKMAKKGTSSVALKQQHTGYLGSGSSALSQRAQYGLVVMLELEH